MGIGDMGDKVGDMAEQAVEKTGGADKTKEHIRTAADKVDSATGGKFEGAIDKGEEAARSGVDKLSKKKHRK